MLALEKYTKEEIFIIFPNKETLLKLVKPNQKIVCFKKSTREIIKLYIRQIQFIEGENAPF